jgi:hypothetical protein
VFISLTFDVEMKIESWLFVRAKSGMIFVLGNVESKMKSRELGANFGARFGGSEAGVLALVFKGFMNLREDVVRWWSRPDFQIKLTANGPNLFIERRSVSNGGGSWKISMLGVKPGRQETLFTTFFIVWASFMLEDFDHLGRNTTSDKVTSGNVHIVSSARSSARVSRDSRRRSDRSHVGWARSR